MKISRELKTALFAIIAIALFLTGYNYLKGKNVFDNSITASTKFENSFGLIRGTVVSLDGVEVGKVVDVRNDFSDKGVIVDFTIGKGIPFTNKSSVVLIKDVLGGLNLALLPVKEGNPIKSGDFIQNKVDKGLVGKLEESLSGLSTDLNSTLKSADTLLVSLNNLATDESDKGLKHAISELNTTLRSFKGLSNSLNAFINKDDSKLNTMLSELSVTLKSFKAVAEDLTKSDLNKTVENLDKTLISLQGVLTKLNSKEGTAGLLMNDPKLYNNLEGATKELEALLKDIKLHPKRYFRVLSKKEIPYQEEN